MFFVPPNTIKSISRLKNVSCISIEEDGQVIYSVWQKGSEESRSVSKYIKASEQKTGNCNIVY